MKEPKVTINTLLNDDQRKHMAELLLNKDIKNMVIVYRTENDFQCDTSEEAIATTIGMLDMAKAIVMNEFLIPRKDVEDLDSEEENV